MVSDFRRKKLLRGFQALDTDKSGIIEKADFDMAVERMKKSRGWTDDDPKYKSTKDFMTKYWEGIQAQADTDNDGQVTEEEWLKVWEEYSPSSPREWQANFAKAIFENLDHNNDGSIDREDFVKALNTRPERKKEDIEVAFGRISKGKPKVTIDDFQELWKEYFTSEDPNAPGNFIFGYLN